MDSTILNVRIPNALAKELAAHKKSTGVPTSETVRRALKCWLDPMPCELCLANPPEKIEHADE
jgi:hypothetical protein